LHPVARNLEKFFLRSIEISSQKPDFSGFYGFFKPIN